jgi:hypothetical protein
MSGIDDMMHFYRSWFRASQFIGPLGFEPSHNHHTYSTTCKMSAQAVKAAGKAASKAAEGHVLSKGAKRDPELYVRSSNHLSSGAFPTIFAFSIGMLTYFPE